MGPLKTAFVACVGIGIAAGAGYYFYKNFISKAQHENDKESSVSVTQVTDGIKESKMILLFELGQGL